ncbi:MAG TPA: heme-copper oxidase subunit III [Flavisolibacter sp.]|nr:heme-copper oxidase subunit III [Flavisolibacter sp.]
MNKLMMKLTIGSESIFFLSLIIAYLYFWRNGNFQKEVAEHMNVKTTGIYTLILISSSFTFRMAEKNFLLNKEKKVRGWLLSTIVLGAIFLAGQGHEYYKLIQEHVTISESEFGSSFYTLTGFHGLHVLIGLIILCIVLALLWKGYIRELSSPFFRVVGMYWHFVDIVWIFVFSTIYLLPYII